MLKNINILMVPSFNKLPQLVVVINNNKFITEFRK